MQKCVVVGGDYVEGDNINVDSKLILGFIEHFQIFFYNFSILPTYPNFLPTVVDLLNNTEMFKVCANKNKLQQYKQSRKIPGKRYTARSD